MDTLFDHIGGVPALAEKFKPSIVAIYELNGRLTFLDATVFSDMELIRKLYQPELAFLPIW